MAKLKSNYEQTLWVRFIRWMKGGSDALENSMIASLEEKAEPNLISAEELAEREHALEEQHRKDLESERQFFDKMHSWSRTRGSRITDFLYRLMSVVICLAIIYILLNTVSQLPKFGDSNNPLNNEVSERYIEKGMEETGAVNIVAGMILDYRAFDTLGESHVLFIAACSVLILLKLNLDKDGRPAREKLDAEANDRVYEPKSDDILQKIAALLVPIAMLFGIYIVLNGHISPGGGFSGGAIIGAALILHLNAFGYEKTGRFFSYTTFRVVSYASLSFYAIAKAYSFFTGANHLESIITPGNPGDLMSAGLILPLNIAVGLVVACTMYAFYTLFRKGDV
ncbi:MAG: hypothetical protein IJE08_05645 [Clostridia bacterium]|nr:hypothetical protein [Clostridia bacterium]